MKYSVRVRRVEGQEGVESKIQVAPAGKEDAKRFKEITKKEMLSLTDPDHSNRYLHVLHAMDLIHSMLNPNQEEREQAHQEFQVILEGIAYRNLLTETTIDSLHKEASPEHREASAQVMQMVKKEAEKLKSHFIKHMKIDLEDLE